MIGLLLCAVSMRACDKKYSGRGLTNIYHSGKGSKKHLYTYAEKYADTGLMVNSIRAGMTIIMLVALQRDRDRYLSQAQSDNIISLPLAARGESAHF